MEHVDQEAAVAVTMTAAATTGQATIPAVLVPVPAPVPAENERESATSLLSQRERRRSSITNSKKKKKKKKEPQPLPIRMPTVARPPSLPLLVCSVGNPGAQYANTLHSAGHTVLNTLAAHLGYQHFSKDRSMGNGLVSKPQCPGTAGDWTLWQSTSYMNESGKGVRAAHQHWSRALADGEGKLVIVHDELEKPLGAVSLRTAQGLSAKGHNGLKSILSLIGKTPFARIGIGIGRPASRQSDDVAKYVLKKMDAAEKAAIDESVEHVVAKLKLLEQGKG